MLLSLRIKRLIVISIAIVILAFASNESLTYVPSKIVSKPTTSYPVVPNDINPDIIDPSIVGEVHKTAVIAQVKPAISAEAYLVKDLDTGEIYIEHNSGTVFPIASLSKLVTAIVATHSMSPDKGINITQSMLDAYGEAGHLVLGETLSASELLYPLLLESSNDAALAYAESYGYDAFIKDMNIFVSKLGMYQTSFRDPSGLSSGNASNARDLFILAQYIYKNEKPLLEITRETTITLASTTDHGLHIFNTINPFPFDPHFMGGKTGRTTQAKESMVSLFQYTYKATTYHMAVIVLRSDLTQRQIDSSVLFGRSIRIIEAK